MNPSRLASKKNVILLAVVAAVIVFLVGSYYAKQSRLQKQAALGGEVEFLLRDLTMHPKDFGFLRFHAAKIAYIADLKTPLTLPSGVFESQVRAIDDAYPLRGKMQFDRKHFKIIFTQDFKDKIFGVAVNDIFLQQSGMKFGDSFKMGENNYQIRGIIQSLPDDTGQQLNTAGPLLMIKHWTLKGSGMFKNATNRDLRYFVLSKKLSAKEWETQFRQKFPKSPAKIRRWD